MSQLPFGFDPDGGTFSNIKLPPPVINDRYVDPPQTAGWTTSTRRLNRWQRFDRFISNIGNWFSENYDETVDRLQIWVYFLMMVVAAIAVIITWVNSGFIMAIVAGVIAFIVCGLCFYVSDFVLPIITGIFMFAGRFIFWNAITFLLFLCVLFGGIAQAAFDIVPTRENIEVVESREPLTYECTADILNVRSQPNTSSAVRGGLLKGEKFEVKEISGDFARIEYKGKAGYVAVKYIKPVNDGK